jgi:hypothetical protein
MGLAGAIKVKWGWQNEHLGWHQVQSLHVNRVSPANKFKINNTVRSTAFTWTALDGLAWLTQLTWNAWVALNGVTFTHMLSRYSTRNKMNTPVRSSFHMNCISWANMANTVNMKCLAGIRSVSHLHTKPACCLGTVHAIHNNSIGLEEQEEAGKCFQ